jgi:hypothetical protein
MSTQFVSWFKSAILPVAAVVAFTWQPGQLLAQNPQGEGDKFATATKDLKAVPGLIKTYYKDERLLFELSPSNLNRDFIVLISIARGIGEGQLLGGMSWGFGDDWLWQFRKVDENIHIVRRNVRFTAKPGSPEEKAVRLAFTDSVLFALPIIANGPGGSMLIDVTPVFMSDLPQIGRALPGFSFAAKKSTWQQVKGFKDNIELQVAATYASDGGADFDTVPDSRGLTINVHYSISLLPNTGYQPRLADDRVGYFLTAIKDYSRSTTDGDRFVRYINRWDLRKADPTAEVSPPVKPIIFWLEKTVPFQYRKPIRDGILEWNKAFEKIGFVNAVEVRQQPDDADWDPEDINYNTFRWITASAGFAMGPSRVNPTNGQILDADIIFDADFITSWKEEYETFTPDKVAALTGGPLDLKSYLETVGRQPPHHEQGRACRCDLHHGFAFHMAFGDAVARIRYAGEAKPLQEKLIMEGLKEVVMHEVGHTLGLRHNFKASTLLDPKDLHNVEKTAQQGLVASVMDYSPSNIAPQGVAQGHYYTQTIGPYDYWAIEYGYKPLSGGSDGEVKELQKIAARCAEPGLTYATDEDTRGIDSDPLSNRFDLSSDPIGYAKMRSQMIGELWPGLVERIAEEGEGYQQVRRAFSILLGNYGQSMYFSSRFIGGLYVHRDHKGDKDGRPPFVVVPAAKQREALALLEEQVFNDKPFQFPPELYNYLASSRWSHWGTNDRPRLDIAVHEVIGMWQERILSQLLSPLTLARLHDSELKVPADQDAFTAAELIQRLTAAIFAELESVKEGEFTARKPAVSSLRRNLQRSYLRQLSNLAMGNSGAPQDCQTVAFVELQSLDTRILDLLKRPSVKLDPYTRAHLTESSSRIQKVIEAHLTLARP